MQSPAKRGEGLNCPLAAIRYGNRAFLSWSFIRIDVADNPAQNPIPNNKCVQEHIRQGRCCQTPILPGAGYFLPCARWALKKSERIWEAWSAKMPRALEGLVTQSVAEEVEGGDGDSGANVRTSASKPQFFDVQELGFIPRGVLGQGDIDQANRFVGSAAIRAGNAGDR